MKMSCFKLQVSFSLNFASLLIVFLAETVRDLGKRSKIGAKEQSANFQALDCSRKILPNFYFDSM